MAAGELRIGSLFSGVGGLDLGVQSVLGGRIAWHCENDLRAIAVLARHWPDTPNLGDVRAVDFHEVEPVDVLTAGFPCQELSLAGPRTGLAGPRSGLWQHTARAIRILRPSLVVVENVPGLLSTRAGSGADEGGGAGALESCPSCLGEQTGQPRMRALGVVLSELAGCGYDSGWLCVRACDIGAPHRRSRVFLAAWPAVSASGAAVEDSDGESGEQRRLPAPCQAQGRGSWPDLGRRGRAPAAHPEGERRCEGVPQSALPQRRPHPRLHRGHTHLTECPGRRRREAAAHPDNLRRPRRCGYDSEAQGRHESANCRHSPEHWWADYLPAIRRWEHVTGRPAPSPTVPGTRRLSPSFVEWMMLPNGWVTETEGLSRAAQLHLLGNSVVPQQAARALHLLLAERSTPCSSPVSSRCSSVRSGQ
ncbi:DNA (cytosine-5-)-methyltransferase [Streptomyces sp. T-3]|nr:DNA (cytosine-5-)-methyltransferase [Streptomyces sp. T-3]